MLLSNCAKSQSVASDSLALDSDPGSSLPFFMFLQKSIWFGVGRGQETSFQWKPGGKAQESLDQVWFRAEGQKFR